MRVRRVRAGRPLGEVSLAVLRATEQRPLPAREIATLLQVPIRTAYKAVENLTNAGYLQRLSSGAVPQYQRRAMTHPQVELSLADVFRRR